MNTVLNAPNLNYCWAALVVEELVRNGVTAFCISPGSRSAPLAMAAASNEGARCFVHLDERANAFRALGHAKATGSPAAFICTSGTAVANALPAVVEASMSEVPLVLLTADRPPELLDVGANQAIDQDGIFANYLRWSHRLPCPDAQISPEVVLTTVDQAVYRAQRAPSGPVHLNCMFREPLAPVECPYDGDQYLRSVAGWLKSSTPYTRYGGVERALGEEDWDLLRDLLKSSQKGLLVVGQLSSCSDIDAAETIAAHLKWPILPDVTSGLRFGADRSLTVHGYDLLLQSGGNRALLAKADTIVHLGGGLVSKGWLSLLDDGQQRAYINVARSPVRRDPVHKVSYRFESGLAEFAAGVTALASPTTDAAWRYALLKSSATALECVRRVLGEEDTLNEVATVRTVLGHTPAESVLFLGNSMPIRDADAFSGQVEGGFSVAANRGASGIDGNIATAVGYCESLDAPTTVVIGDLAALHDVGSLHLLRTTRRPFILVVINNNGGGIFSMLPVSEVSEHFESIFGTPHGSSLAGIAEGFGLSSFRPSSNLEFGEMYRAAVGRGESCVIEVVTEREANAALHTRLREAVDTEGDSG